MYDEYTASLIKDARTNLAAYRKALNEGSPFTAKLASTYAKSINTLLEVTGWPITRINRIVIDMVEA